MENLGKNFLYLLLHHTGTSLGLTQLIAEDGDLAVGDQEVRVMDHTGGRFHDRRDPTPALTGSLENEVHLGRSIVLILEMENV